MLTSKAGPNAFVSHWSLFGSCVSDWLGHHCYIISFILNSRFGQRYWLRELFALSSKNSRAPICIRTAALFQSCYFILPTRCAGSRQLPALHIRFARQSWCSIFLCTSCSTDCFQIFDSQALGICLSKHMWANALFGAVLDCSCLYELRVLVWGFSFCSGSCIGVWWPVGRSIAVQ